jgi:hypothetical protein
MSNQQNKITPVRFTPRQKAFIKKQALLQLRNQSQIIRNALKLAYSDFPDDMPAQGERTELRIFITDVKDCGEC